MKVLNACLSFLIAVMLFSGCQNELSFDPVNPALGSLKKDSITGDCYPSLVAGNYFKDTTLTSTNYIEVQVNVAVAGTYDIRTDTLNGYHFHGSGTFINTGLNTAHLSGNGMPLAVGTDIFQVRFDTSVCEIAVTVVAGTAPLTAFTFGSTGSACTGAVLAGTYTSGVAMTASNTVTLNVNVTNGGPYSITTPTVNGVFFSGSGTLSTSTTSIVLTAQGTPAISSTSVNADYTVTATSGSCSFPVIFAPVPGPASFTFDCGSMNGVIYGLTRIGTPLNPTINADTVTVNVITTGTYTISSVVSMGSPDGVSFSTSGIFTTTGTQDIILSANGTPNRAGFVFYNITSPQATNTTPCSTGAYYDFLISTIGTAFNRNFTFSSATTFDNTTLAGYDLVRMKGFASAVSTESLELIIGLPTGGSFNNTSSTDVVYTANDLPLKYVKAIYKDAANPQVSYIAESGATPQTNPFTINISFCTGGRIEGTFSGVVKDNNGTGPGTKTISGYFGLVR